MKRGRLDQRPVRAVRSAAAQNLCGRLRPQTNGSRSNLMAGDYLRMAAPANRSAVGVDPILELPGIEDARQDARDESRDVVEE